MKGESRAREYQLRTEDVHQNSRLKDDGGGSFATLARALRRDANRLERGNKYLQGNPTAW